MDKISSFGLQIFLLAEFKRNQKHNCIWTNTVCEITRMYFHTLPFRSSKNIFGHHLADVHGAFGWLQWLKHPNKRRSLTPTSLFKFELGSACLFIIFMIQWIPATGENPLKNEIIQTKNWFVIMRILLWRQWIVTSCVELRTKNIFVILRILGASELDGLTCEDPYLIGGFFFHCKTGRIKIPLAF